MFYYCSNCLFRISDEEYDDNDYDDEKHREKFGCQNFDLVEIEENQIQDKYWIWGILEQLNEAEQFLIGGSTPKNNEVEYIGAFGLRYEIIYQRQTRIAYILIDNAIELILYSKIFLTPIKDKLKKTYLEKLKNSYHEKINFFLSENLVSENEKNMLIVYHQIRNKLYHTFIPQHNLFLKLSNTYLVFCRDFLLKIFNIVYPLIEKKTNILKFEESEVVNLLLEILIQQIDQLKKKLRKEKREIFQYRKNVLKKTLFCNFKDYIEFTLKLSYFSRGKENHIKTFAEMYNKTVPIEMSYKNLKDLKYSGLILANLPENTIEKIQNKITQIIRQIAKINDINEILDNDTRLFYDYIELQEDILKENYYFGRKL